MNVTDQHLGSYPPPPPPYPWPQGADRPRRGRRPGRFVARAAGVVAIALAAIVAGIVGLAVLYIVLEPSPHAVVPSAADNAVAASVTWPSAFDPFSSLVGSGPGTGDAWNTAVCRQTSLGATGEVATVACAEPDQSTVFVSEFGSPAQVQALLDGDVTDGGTRASDPNGEQAVTSTSSSGGASIATSFAGEPTFLVTFLGSTPAAVQSDWSTAPLPTS